MEASTFVARRILAERLCTALGFLPTQVDEFKHTCIVSGYFSLPDHEGGDTAFGNKYYKGGRRYTYDDVPWKTILEVAEDAIKRAADPADRTIIFYEVMQDLPLTKSYPDWARTLKNPKNPNAKPSTTYSAYRAKEGEEAPSNAHMMVAFSQATGLEGRSLQAVQAQITWWDACGDDSRPATVAMDTFTVTGGRLGRDHTLEDVPSHFVRDKLMDYALTQLSDKSKQDAAYRALCPDLYGSEIIEYTMLIAKDKVNRDKACGITWPEAFEPGPSLENTRQHIRKNANPPGAVARLKEAIDTCDPQSIGEMRNMIREEQVLDAIDENIDLTPVPHFRPIRTHLLAVPNSVIKPGPKVGGKSHADMLPVEEEIPPINEDIDQDCDQVRAMIKIFIRENEDWNLDKFRGALKIDGRHGMLSFLEMKGPVHGIDNSVFQLSWEFFKRRQKLNLPLKGAPSESVLQERDANQNRGRKRRSEGGEEEQGNCKKATKTAANGKKSSGVEV
ncbi:hypothetical protein F5Y16DRAFT_374932 [Xylariaceae sp. FL0255]|nr:hypothetical protein F5Y16DRAFT_374932 [Xylariaceae sp. FL0255]